MISIDKKNNVAILKFQRPEALNAFNEEMFDSVADALLNTAEEDDVKVLIITGAGRAFSAGLDLTSVGVKAAAPKHGFPGMFEAFIEYPKPILLAINGIGVGFGCTICGLADLVFMAESARLKCPFTSLGLSAEAGSTITFPGLMGHQAATWALMSSEWLDAESCKQSGLVFSVCPDDALLSIVSRHADILAEKSLSSLITNKELLMAPKRDALREVNEVETVAISSLMGGPANLEAIAAFKEKREADFSAL